MTADVELPEPKYPVDGAGDEDSYNSGWNDCLAECRHATAAKDAEIEALRAEVDGLRRERAVLLDKLNGTPCAEVRWRQELERLAEALGEVLEWDAASNGLPVALCLHIKAITAAQEKGDG